MKTTPDFEAQKTNAPAQPEQPADAMNPDGLAKEDLVPLTTAQSVWILIIMSIPLLNLIMMLHWAYAERGNESRRSLARAGLILTGVLLGAAVLALGIVFAGLSAGWITVPYLL